MTPLAILFLMVLPVGGAALAVGMGGRVPTIPPEQFFPQARPAHPQQAGPEGEAPGDEEGSGGDSMLQDQQAGPSGGGTPAGKVGCRGMLQVVSRFGDCRSS